LHTPAEENLSPLGKEHKRLGHVGRYKLLELARVIIHHYQQVIVSCECWGEWSRDVDMDELGVPCPSRTVLALTVARHLELLADYAVGHLEWVVHYIVGVPAGELSFPNVCALVPMVGKIERRLGEKVRFVRSDKDMEFDKNEAQQWYRQQGIIHQLSTVYTPELNGTIERFMRMTKEMIASMIDDSRLGHLYWDHAARYTATILMKTSNTEDGGNPWKKLAGRDPSIGFILRFGSMCFVHVPKERGRKQVWRPAKQSQEGSSDRMKQ
jgi:transposase InsO family protein